MLRWRRQRSPAPSPIPTPFTLGATSVTTTGTQLNYLAAATGTTGTTSTNVVFSTSPTLVTPVLGVATGTSLALSGCTISTDKLCLTGNSTTTGIVKSDGATTTTPAVTVGVTGETARISLGLLSDDTARLAMGSGGTRDLFLTYAGAAKWKLGTADAASPVAQTLTMQGAINTNNAGALFTIDLSASTGSAAGGGMKVRGTAAGSGGSSQNTYSDLLSLTTTGFTISPNTFISNAYIGNGTSTGLRANSSGAFVDSSSPYAYMSTANLNGSADTSTSRIGAGIVGAGTGAAGSVAGEFRAAIHSVGTLTTWANNQTCTAGQSTWDASFIYVCTATNTVKRATLASF
jgi:hypothetical protein